MDIEGNLIRASPGYRDDCGIAIMKEMAADVRIIDNTIEGMETGARLCDGEIGENRFPGNTVNLEVQTGGDAGGMIDPEMNWWGTADGDEIEAKIVDCNDDPQIAGCVDYEPWCMDEACT